MPKGGAVAKGDVVRLDESAVAGEAVAVATPGALLAVVYESSNVVVVDKPAGQPTAPLRGGETGTLVNALIARYAELVPTLESFIGHSPREPGIIHRLDTETSGAVVAARTRAAFDELKAALKEGRIDKRYLLVCAQEGLADQGSIEHPLASHPKDQRRVYVCVHPRDVVRYAPRPATTRWTVKVRGERWALVEVTVGRALRHQIRAHFASIGHPLAGDVLYGGAEVRALGRHALHASRVAFAGGAAVEAFDVTVPLAPDVRALVES
jgi:23S rRNA pseudouridine1911/1915/1917 synthase